MTTINAHVWAGGPGTRCTVCGSVRRDDTEGTPLSCISRMVSDRAPTDRRILAADDSDVIAARIAELRAEREAAYNAEPEPETAERQIVDYRDCCA